MISVSDPLDVEAIRARLDAATPGPWEAGLGWVYTMPVYADDNRLSNVLGMDYADADRAEAERERAQRNAEFIAAARSDIPQFLAALAEVTRERDEARRYCDHMVERSIAVAAERDAARAERDAMLPVVEAVGRWRAAAPGSREYQQAADALDAVWDTFERETREDTDD